MMRRNGGVCIIGFGVGSRVDLSMSGWLSYLSLASGGIDSRGLYMCM